MKAVIQRVLQASVNVGGVEISRIGKGLMCLIGISANDTHEDMEYIVKKILSLKVFPETGDEALAKQWARSVADIEGEVLCVSQFTLYASTRKGSKPDFHAAMGTQASKEFYAGFLKRMGESYRPDRIKDGEFGAMMNVFLTNEGPVTILLDSQETRSGSKSASGSTTPALAGQDPDTSAKEKARADFAAEKQRKKEAYQRQQAENKQRKEDAAQRWASRSEGQDRPADV